MLVVGSRVCVILNDSVYIDPSVIYVSIHTKKNENIKKKQKKNVS